MAPVKIQDGIHQISVPMRRNPLGKTYSYFLEDSKTLIDTGISTDDAFQGLRKELKALGYQPDDIEKIIVTHLHHDHIGLVDRFRSNGAEVLASWKAAEREESLRELWENMFDFTKEELKLFGGAQHLNFLTKFEYAFRGMPEPLHIDRQLKDGETLELNGANLEIIWTPGHAREHICLWNQERKLLFSGDHVLPKITSHVSLHTYEDDNPLGDYLNSLTKVRELPAEKILPGHERIFTNLKGRIDQLHEHHRRRLNEMKNVLKGVKRTVYQIGSRVHWDSRPWPQMTFWTKRMAAAETYSHLVYLRERGEVKETLVKGVLYYSPA